MDTQYKYHRKSIRLKDYDYSQNGAYFITICTDDKKMLFGDVINEKIKTNNLGNLIISTWQSLPDRYPVIIDTFQIMPNHFHGIIIIDQFVGATLVVARTNMDDQTMRAGTSPAPTISKPTLGNIIGAFKSLTTNIWSNGKFWQRNYYEHVIRNDHDFDQISQYIIYNPLMWGRDRNNPDAKKDLTPW